MSDADVGVTASEVRVGFTKKPRQLIARARVERAAKVAKRRSFRLKQDILKKSRQTYFYRTVRYGWL